MVKIEEEFGSSPMHFFSSLIGRFYSNEEEEKFIQGGKTIHHSPSLYPELQLSR
jgi:hypothetical protein